MDARERNVKNQWQRVTFHAPFTHVSPRIEACPPVSVRPRVTGIRGRHSRFLPLHSLATDRSFTCVNCEAEIRSTPVFYVGLAFCCGGCVAGGPCLCSYDDEDSDPGRSTTQAPEPDLQASEPEPPARQHELLTIG
jgi:hypothetical protein